uniref:ABC transporter permease n=1 Tax=Prevotella sp. TaxID=59823 RepID=UPI003FEEFE87
MFNNIGGYGNFILPGVLVLILQQVLLLGIGMSMGTSMEEKRLQRISGMLAKPFGLGRIMIGRTLALFGFFTLIGTYVLLAVPKMFNFVHILHGSDFAMFLVPYLLACIFFAYTFSFFVRQRENVMLLVVFTSVPFLFMSGVSWPKSNIPEAWSYVSYLIPSTFGIQGFVKMNTMGAVFSDIIPEVKALWIQAIIYFCTACAASRWQIKQCCK